MRRSDLADVIKITNASESQMNEKRMDRLVSKAGVVCLVAEVGDKIVGAIIYDVSRISKIKVSVLAVDETFRRRGIGRGLMELVSAKLNKKRNKIELAVSEYNLAAQLFLRSMGFKAVAVLASEGGPSDYRFMYKYEETASAES